MPQVVNYGSNKSSGQGPASNKPPFSDQGKQDRLKLQITAGICIVLVLLAFMAFRAYVIGPQAPALKKVAPPPGYPDEAPYNTESWQKATKNGARPMMSGMPPASALQSPNASNGTAPASSGQ
ncbi:MAG TPA: hypothetical protein VFB21_06845 [Chthonomonadaceae bacterium]|nr:hypothetical protein [Chthonomonadaceae bacterium]